MTKVAVIEDDIPTSNQIKGWIEAGRWRAQVEKRKTILNIGASSIAELGIVEKMQGYRGYYKSRFGSYRVGMKLENDTLILQVVMDRKDIYKFFP